MCWFEVFQRDVVRKWMTIIGIILICATMGIFTFYGNLLTYTDSYFLVRGHQGFTDMSATVLSASVITLTLMLIFSDKVTKRLPRSVSMLMGLALYDVSFLLGYWDVRWAPWVFIINRGLLAGMGTGLCLATSYLYLIEWTSGKNLGSISSVATASAKGSIIVNQLITAYINPENLTPDLSHGHTKYFQQDHILDRVPSSFLVLALTFSVVHLCGFVLLRDRHTPDDVIQTQSLSPGTELALTREDGERHNLELTADNKEHRKKTKPIHSEELDDSGDNIILDRSAVPHPPPSRQKGCCNDECKR